MGKYNIQVEKIVLSLIQFELEFLRVDMENGDNDQRWFLLDSFEKPSSGQIQNSPFFSLVGWDLTEFLSKGINANQNIQILFKSIEDLKERRQKEKIELEFHQDFKWVYYKSA